MSELPVTVQYVSIRSFMQQSSTKNKSLQHVFALIIFLSPSSLSPGGHLCRGPACTCIPQQQVITRKGGTGRNRLLLVAPIKRQNGVWLLLRKESGSLPAYGLGETAYMCVFESLSL